MYAGVIKIVITLTLGKNISKCFGFMKDEYLLGFLDSALWSILAILKLRSYRSSYTKPKISYTYSLHETMTMFKVILNLKLYLGC